MSAPSSFGVGLGATSRAVSNTRGQIIVGPGGAADSSIPLLTVGMPHLSLWIRQISPVVVGGGASVSFQFSVRPYDAGQNLGSGKGPDEWLDLLATPLVLDPSGTPSIQTIFFPAAKIRIFAEGALPATTIEYVLGCSA